MNRYTLPAVLGIFAMAASCQKENKEKPTEKVASSTIASVQLQDDCPDPVPAKSAADEPPTSYKPASAPQRPAAIMPAKAVADEDPPSENAPSAMREVVAADRLMGLMPAELACTQSTIQIVFEGQGPKASKVSIKEIRLLTPEGKKLATIKSRLPTAWAKNVYTPWDEILKPNADTKAGYKISPPDWSAVGKELGGSSYGQMFILEVDIDVGGQSQTVRSTKFARVQPQAMPT